MNTMQNWKTEEVCPLNMKQWLSDVMASPVKKPLPILSFPGIQLMDSVTVRDLVQNSDLQAACMKKVAENTDALAAVSFMDLSLEAEAFGAEAMFSDDEVPAIVGALISSEEEAEALEVPAVGAGRTGIAIEAIRKVKEMITDRPILAGVLGPFSMTGRLVDVSEAMIYCFEEPDMLHILLEKCAQFTIEYIKAFKEAGANGVVMAEPLSGLLAPSQEEEFSAPYVKKIADAVCDDDFIVVYHNCGDYVNRMTESIAANGCSAYHFGNSTSMKEMLEKMPKDVPVMGNIDPASQFKHGTPESMKAAVEAMMAECGGYANYVPSSGCDLPPAVSWDNINAFFDSVKSYYTNK